MLLNIGFGNLINTQRLVAVVAPDSAPVRRLVGDAKEKGACIDATQGRKTQSVLICDCDIIVLSALSPEKLSFSESNAKIEGVK
jgi:regulator of extracellular matrix RemA (YlzA/DUF370 family)